MAQQARPKVIGHKDPVFDQLMTVSRLVVTKPSLNTPSRLMSFACHGRATRMHLSFPVQCALLPLVDEADDQDAEKEHHRPEARGPDLAQGHGPGKEKGDLEIEQDEEDG